MSVQFYAERAPRHFIRVIRKLILYRKSRVPSRIKHGTLHGSRRKANHARRHSGSRIIHGQMGLLHRRRRWRIGRGLERMLLVVVHAIFIERSLLLLLLLLLVIEMMRVALEHSSRCWRWWWWALGRNRIKQNIS